MVKERTDPTSEANDCDWRKSNQQLHWIWGRVLLDFSQTEKSNQIKSTIALNMRQSSLGFLPNHGTMSVYRQGSESRPNEIPSKPLQTVLCSQFFQECLNTQAIIYRGLVWKTTVWKDSHLRSKCNLCQNYLENFLKEESKHHKEAQIRRHLLQHTQWL